MRGEFGLFTCVNDKLELDIDLQNLIKCVKSLNSFPDMDLILLMNSQALNKFNIDEITWPFGAVILVDLESTESVSKAFDENLQKFSSYRGVITANKIAAFSSKVIEYIYQVTKFYENEPSVISNEIPSSQKSGSTNINFDPYPNQGDVFFSQYVKSNALLWKTAQFLNFIKWFVESVDSKKMLLTERDINPDPKKDLLLLQQAIMRYLEFKDFYIVCPHPRLELLNEKKYELKAFEGSFARYDSWLEPSVEVLKKCNTDLKDLDILVDLHGQKPLAEVKSKYVLTSKKCNNYFKSYYLNHREECRDKNIFYLCRPENAMEVSLSVSLDLCSLMKLHSLELISFDTQIAFKKDYRYNHSKNGFKHYFKVFVNLAKNPRYFYERIIFYLAKLKRVFTL